MINNKNYKEIFNNYNIYILIFVLSFAFSIKAILNPQLVGEDEATTFLTSLRILESIKKLDFIEFLKAIIGANHPPGRYILPLPFISFFGETITSMRIPYFFMWIFSCLICTKIADLIAGKKVAFITGIFISSSGLFNLEVQSLSLGVTVMFGLFIIKEFIKINELKDLISINKIYLNKINIYLFLGFIFFSTWSILIFSFYSMLLFSILNTKEKSLNLQFFFKNNYLFFILYILYYFFFFRNSYLDCTF